MMYFVDTTHFYNTTNRRSGIFLVTLLVSLSFLITGCGDSFLAPEPKSFLSPENTFTRKEGLQGIITSINRQFRTPYYGAHMMILGEYYFSDIAVSGANPAAPVWPRDMTTQVTPTTENRTIKVLDYWSHAYNGITYANTVISNIDNVTDWNSEEEKYAILSAGYFGRAYWYYRLVHQFGDVPVYLTAIEQPRLDFNTYSREAILKQIRDDMEFAVQWLPQSVQPGEVNRAAGYYLLTKIYLSLRQFQDAVDAASQVIDGNGYALMTDRFGQGRYADDPRFNVLWDLHQKENKSSGANTEAILVVQDDFGVEGATGDGSQRMRYTTPLWWFGSVRDPNGFNAVTDGPEGNPLSDSLGRGIGALRTVPYFNYELWNDGGEDLRHSEVNWFSLDDYYYNHPESEYYGEPFVREYIGDTTSTWYPFMYNKLYVPDEIREDSKQGGHSDWYVYRLAGLYLLRAEAHYWLGQMSQAAADINKVRQRAQAQLVSPGEVTIDYIFDERARELYFEEPRKTELTRIAYIMAQLGQNGYNLANMHEDNWFYNRVVRTNVYYREQIQYGANPFRMEPYHVYWPVPQDEIDSNVQGHINQSRGYPGAGDNVDPLGYEDIKELRDPNRPF